MTDAWLYCVIICLSAASIAISLASDRRIHRERAEKHMAVWLPGWWPRRALCGCGWRSTSKLKPNYQRLAVYEHTKALKTRAGAHQ